MIKNYKEIWSTLFKTCWKNTILFITLHLVGGLLPGVQLWAIQYSVDGLNHFFIKQNKMMNMITPLLLLALVLLLLVIINKLLADCLVRLEMKLTETYAPMILRKLDHIPYPYYDDENLYHRINRIRHEPYQAYLKGFQYSVEVMRNLITLFTVGVFFVQISITFALLNVVLIAFIMVADYKIMQVMDRIMSAQSEDERLYTHFRGLYERKSALYEIKIFQSHLFFREKSRQLLQRIYRYRLKGSLQGQLYLLVSSLLTAVWGGSLMLVGMNQLITGSITIGLFISLLNSIMSVYNTSGTLSSNFSELTENIVEIENIKKFMSLKDDTRLLISEDVLSPGQIVIEFIDVGFKYPNQDSYTLRNINFRITSADKLAIVGENGAGKSTLIKLMCGLYPATEGKVTINGRNINSLSRNDIFGVFSVMFQDHEKYSMTMKDNILLYSDEADADKSGERIKKTLDMLGLERYEDMLNCKLGKLTSSSINLSEGQWQKIGLSRVLLANTPMIVLDEPTSAMDPISESKLYADFKKVSSTRGVILVSHRLGSATIADKLLVLKAGSVLDIGTHAELMERCAYYKEMYERQSSWYRAEA